jgi:subtilisin family serine protease
MKTPIILCSLLLLVVNFTVQASTHCKLLFELEPRYTTIDRQPTEEWRSQLSINRDGSDKGYTISAVKWAGNAEQNPLLHDVFSLKVEDESTISDWLQRINETQGVKWVELEPVRYTCAFNAKSGIERDAPPNDPYYPLQWYLHKVSAPAAWDLSKGDENIIVAVIDVGVDVDHPDLRPKCWKNTIEENGREGVDDDGNGYIDDIYGWDFHDDDPDPRPSDPIHDHGTHVAGIACAATNNGYGIAGISGDCRLMSVRCGVSGYITTGYEGVVYAASMGADIINLSWGSTDPSNIERLTIEYATEQGALVVAAAGNYISNNDTHYPAAYENVLSIGVVTEGDQLTYYSKYGDWLDLTAPGDTIISTFPGGGFGILSGTSMSAPLVAGAAALLKSIHPDWTPEQLSMQIINSSDPIERLNPEYQGMMGRGRLNTFRMLSDARSGFDILSVEFDDSTRGNGDGIIDSYEDILITVEITNLLTYPANVTGRLITDDRYVLINPTPYDFGETQPGDTSSNFSQPFAVEMRSISSAGRQIECYLKLSGSDMIDQSLPVIINARSPFDDHDNGSVSLTVSNYGMLGYWNYLTGEDIGNSFRYNEQSIPVLFHGSLMIGVPPSQVSDCAFGNDDRSIFDFNSTSGGFKIHDYESGRQEGHAEFNDDRAEQSLSVSVRQDSYSYKDSPDDDYIILSYTITAERSAINGMYVGLFLDWDIVQSDANNCVWFNEAEVGYMEYNKPGWFICGAGMLDQTPSFHVALENYDIVVGSGAWSDSLKMASMLNGFNNSNSNEASDWTQLIGAGPFSLGRGESKTVTFAVLAADDRDDMVENINAAREKWNTTISSHSSDPLTSGFKLISAYPSPFNSRVNILCKTDISGLVNWTIYDQNGRLVFKGDRFNIDAGMFNLPIEGVNLPSGRYFVRLHQKNKYLSVPITLTR